ncbi:MAG: NAD(P)H nitroreductase [SAR324 cluster bacterium]|uniref:NAD(P)H nitroreductase n=1 Tax=SAR324 cluster bacterium TaxID=2024889 RepID=A0A7X9IJF6_9DELT|nr:NAD(P)H nitroreductase [SAR324 cluster bacterium]
MSFIDLVHSRQSCRAYEDKKVDRELIDKCIEAARLAPSACNSQPWSFIVVDTEPIRSELAQAAFSGIYSLNKFALKSPVIIVMITERSKYMARLGGQIRRVEYNLIDIGIAGEHLDLQAAELGLGCCWLGWFNEKQVKRVLKLPQSTRIDILFSLGYPKEQSIREKKRSSLDDIRRFL